MLNTHKALVMCLLDGDIVSGGQTRQSLLVHRCSFPEDEEGKWRYENGANERGIEILGGGLKEDPCRRAWLQCEVGEKGYNVMRNGGECIRGRDGTT